VSKIGRVPQHLSKEAKIFYKKVVAEYLIDDAAGLKILQVALEAFDRAQSARISVSARLNTIIRQGGSQRS
jgi:hypothetical protein